MKKGEKKYFKIISSNTNVQENIVKDAIFFFFNLFRTNFERNRRTFFYVQTHIHTHGYTRVQYGHVQLTLTVLLLPVGCNLL